MEKQRKLHLEMIRIIAVFLVIFNHTDGFIYYTETTNRLTWLFSLGMAGICRIAVPLFFMVSGALLLDKEESVKDLFQKRVARILTILIAFSLFYYFMDCIRYGWQNTGMTDFFEKLCTNGIRESFWFLYMYLAMLLTLPFFRKMAKHLGDKLMIYLMLLKILFSVLIPLVNISFEISVYLDAGFVGDFAFYMLLGYYMEKKDMSLREMTNSGILLLGIGGFAILDMVIMWLFYRWKGSYQTALLDLFICVTAPMVWMLVRRIAERIKPGLATKLLLITGGCVFGIYLLDNFVRWQLLPVYLFLCEKTVGVLACSAYVMLTFLLGLMYTFVLKKIPLVNRFL